MQSITIERTFFPSFFSNSPSTWADGKEKKYYDTWCQIHFISRLSMTIKNKCLIPLLPVCEMNENDLFLSFASFFMRFSFHFFVLVTDLVEFHATSSMSGKVDRWKAFNYQHNSESSSTLLEWKAFIVEGLFALYVTLSHMMWKFSVDVCLRISDHNQPQHTWERTQHV